MNNNELIVKDKKNEIIIEVNSENTDDIDLFDRYINAVTPKIVKKIEVIIRGSYEYELYILFCKNVLLMDKSTYFSEYNIKNGYSIEIHHSPFTLFDITETVALKALKEKGQFTDMEIAEEVMRLHFEQKVGLMPVDPTTHDLIHSQALTVHPSIPQGNWGAFIEEYKEFMGEEVRDKVREIEFLKTTKPDKNPNILEQKNVTIINNNFRTLYSVELSKLLPGDIK